jgi:hypothetical protein
LYGVKEYAFCTISLTIQSQIWVSVAEYYPYVVVD